MVEELIRERERECVGLTQPCLDAGALQVPPRKVELLLLDVNAVELDTGELLSEHCEDCADAGADLDQARARLELGAVANQPVPPVLGLRHEPLRNRERRQSCSTRPFDGCSYVNAAGGTRSPAAERQRARSTRGCGGSGAGPSASIWSRCAVRHGAQEYRLPA